MEAADSEEIRNAMMMGMLAMTIMAVFVILFVINYQKRQIAQQKHLRDLENRHQKLLLDTALHTEEAERRRIAQDLHDDIGTMLSLTKFSLSQVVPAADAAARTEDAPLENARKLLDETIAQVRRITSELVPASLERFGLVAAVEEFIHKIRDNSRLDVRFECNLNHPPRLAGKTELSLYRIVQELVNNAIKHSACDRLIVRLHYTTGSLQLTVTDNGRGFDENGVRELPAAGHGLRNIESRASIIDGVVTYRTAPGEGCEAKVRVRV